MTLQFAPVFRVGNLVLLRLASLLVPGQHRREWWREWRSELWHVRQACTPQSAPLWNGEREVAAFCLGAFQDALGLRREVGRKKIPFATTKGAAAHGMPFLPPMFPVIYALTPLLPVFPPHLLPS